MSKRQRILRWLASYRECTVDEFVTANGLYVNSWAPTFTYLYQEGRIKPTGETRTTSHGGVANVWSLA